MEPHPIHTTPTIATAWQPCGACWGQRVIFISVPQHGLMPTACDHCLGIGEQLVMHAAA